MACKKEKERVALPEESVSFEQPAGTDVIEVPLNILLDGTTILEMKAVLNGSSSAENHNITFAVDTTKIGDYKAKYGAATLFPTKNYVFYKPISVLPAGANKSETAQLNLGLQSRLTELTTYVLPVVIKTIDGVSVETKSPMYYVIKTGKGFVSKTGWTIAAYSSQLTTATGPTALLDANQTTTFWQTATAQQMPQWVSINFNSDVTFTGLNYYFPTALSYPRLGGYPTSVQIETSMDGTTWANNGVFAVGISTDGVQRIDLAGAVTARYLRFTSLSSVLYINGATQINAIYISDLLLRP